MKLALDDNKKVVGNLLILVFQKFHDFNSASLRVIDFTSSLSGFAYVLYRSAMSCFLTVIAVESPLEDNKRVVVLFLSFPKC